MGIKEKNKLDAAVENKNSVDQSSMVDELDFSINDVDDIIFDENIDSLALEVDDLHDFKESNNAQADNKEDVSVDNTPEIPTSDTKLEEISLDIHDETGNEDAVIITSELEEDNLEVESESNHKKSFIASEDFILTTVEGFGDISPENFLNYILDGKDILKLIEKVEEDSTQENQDDDSYNYDQYNIDHTQYIIPYDPEKEFVEVLDEIKLESDEYDNPFHFESDFLDNNKTKKDETGKLDSNDENDYFDSSDDLIDFGEVDDVESGVFADDMDEEEIPAEKHKDQSEQISQDVNNNDILKELDDITDKLILDLPEGIRSEMPEDFVIEPVDLKEAEKIANEDILFLSEDDLIEELDHADLHLLEEESNVVKSEFESQFDDNLEISINNKDIQYILPEVDSLTLDEKNSIEEDLDSNAIVIEENVNDIKEKYNRLYDNGPNLLDITENIVILEDEELVDSFLESSISKDKKDDMKKLLSYLDGLFEKLPEEIVKNFADSEYFDLYVEVMKKLGV